MSLRITGQAEVGSIDGSRSAAPRFVEADTKSVESAVELAGSPDGSDHADLSNASQLVLLAKTLVPAGKEEKLAALAASVAAGSYRPSAIEVSRSIVQGLLKE